jgi:hypothetical protein
MTILRSDVRPLRFAAALFLLAIASAPVPLSAEELNSSRGFFIDLPEGFSLFSGDGQQNFSFIAMDKQTQADIFAYDPTRYGSIEALSADIIKKLGAQGTPQYFTYAGRQAALAELRFGTGAQAMRGHALFINGEPRAKAGSTPQQDTPGDASYDLVLLAYTASASYTKNRDILLSIIDGFSADAAARSRPGPIGSQARAKLLKAPGSSAPSPSSNAKPAAPVSSSAATIRFGKASLTIPWQAQEGAIAQETVEREYRVLTPYGAQPALMHAAMKRFYRMVWRDSQASLEYLALELSRAWDSGAWAGKERSPTLGGAEKESEAPAQTGAGVVSGRAASAAAAASPASPASAAAGPRFGAPAQSREYAAALLAWTQEWRYERSPQGSDVVNPLSAAMEGRGDCDSRALVLISLLRRENIEGILLISLVHEHALGAFDLPGAGARYPYDGRQWLVAETTAKVDIGLIDQQQSGIADWFAIDFAF